MGEKEGDTKQDRQSQKAKTRKNERKRQRVESEKRKVELNMLQFCLAQHYFDDG